MVVKVSSVLALFYTERERSFPTSTINTHSHTHTHIAWHGSQREDLSSHKIDTNRKRILSREKKQLWGVIRDHRKSMGWG